MRTSKGIYYFPNYQTAREYARKRSIIFHKIICYGLGWAIQYKPYGEYVGTKAGN